MIWLALLATVAIRVGGPWSGYWYGRWGVLLVGLAVIVAARVALRFHWAVGLITLSVLVSGARVIAWPDAVTGVPLSLMIEVERHAATAMAAYLLALLAVGLSSPEQLRKSLRVMGWVMVANAALTLYQRLAYPAQNFRWNGFLGNPSMGGCLMAALIPFLPSVWAVPLIVAAILATSTSMGLGVVAVVLAAWRISDKKRLLLSVVGSAVVFVSGFLMQGSELFSTSRRSEIWAFALRWWDAQGAPWLGVGPGTVAAYIPHAQEVAGVGVEKFRWLHSDWLQLLIEQGWLGLVAGVTVYATALWKSRRRSDVLAALAGFGAMGLANFPLHLATHAGTLAVLMALAFNEAELPEP